MRIAGGKAQIVVDAPVDRVFSYVGDLSRLKKWHNMAPLRLKKKTLQKLQEHNIGYGASMTAVAAVGVTEYVPNERLVWEIEEHGPGSRGARHRWSIEVEPANGGTRITMDWQRTGFSLLEKLLILPLILLLFPLFLLTRLLSNFTVRSTLRLLRGEGREGRRKRGGSDVPGQTPDRFPQASQAFAFFHWAGG